MWGISALFKEIFIIVQDAGHWGRVEANTESPPEMCVCVCVFKGQMGPLSL